MQIDIITIFADMFKGVFSESMVKIAQQKGKFTINIHNLRDYTCDKHRRLDAPPYGGGAGMVLQCEPLFKAVEAIIKSTENRAQRTEKGKSKPKVIFLTPQGRSFSQKKAKEMLEDEHLILLCGHYEGIDQRVRDSLVDEEISVGDYILSGGEVAAMVIVDVLARLIPGVVGDYDSVENESFEDNLLDYPQYTKPRDFRGKFVPSVLLSGDHKKIQEWRKEQALKRTRQRRPDLLKNI